MKIKIIITTTDSNKTAKIIAECLVNDNLSPCVQITPNIQSVYMWKSKLEKSGEVQLIIKTITENVQDCKKLILKHHNYDLPEIVVTNGEILNDKYIGWFIENCREV